MSKDYIKISAGRRIEINVIDLEDVILEKTIMLRFIQWLHEKKCSENLRFWLECQLYKHLKEDNELKNEAKRLYETYFAGECSLNIDDNVLLEDLEVRMNLCDRTVFMNVQNAVWSLIKLESFPKFRAEVGKNMNHKLRPKQFKGLKLNQGYVLGLYEKFHSLTITLLHDPLLFNPFVLPNDEYDDHNNLSTPPIDELWNDEDMMLAFREFLYQQFANENLSFYLEAVKFYYLCPDGEIPAKAREIFDTYIRQDAEAPLNLEYSIYSTIEKEMEHPTRNIFLHVQEKIFEVLKLEWYPEFIVSPLYKQCNDDSVELKRSLKRSKTMDNYKLYVDFRKTQEHLSNENGIYTKVNNTNETTGKTTNGKRKSKSKSKSRSNSSSDHEEKMSNGQEKQDKKHKTTTNGKRLSKGSSDSSGQEFKDKNGYLKNGSTLEIKD